MKDVIRACSLDDKDLRTENEPHETTPLPIGRKQRLWQRLSDELEAMDISFRHTHHMEKYAQRAAMKERVEASREAQDAEIQEPEVMCNSPRLRQTSRLARLSPRFFPWAAPSRPEKAFYTFTGLYRCLSLLRFLHGFYRRKYEGCGKM